MCTQKMRALSYIGAVKITFPPKPDIQTDRHTYKRTDISVYRVDSLLKTSLIYVNYSPFIFFYRSKDSCLTFFSFLSFSVINIIYCLFSYLNLFYTFRLCNVLHDLFIWSVLMWLNLFYSRTFFMPPSRR